MGSNTVMISVDRDLFFETFYRMLSQLSPDHKTEQGKRDLELKREIDSLINYLHTSQHSVSQNAYPSIGITRG